MKISTLIIGIALGAAATTLYHLLASPGFWQSAVSVSEIKFEASTRTAFKTQDAKEPAFSVSKGTICCRLPGPGRRMGEGPLMR